MKRYITVDGGTTNTRVYLVEDGEVRDTVKIPVGSNSPGSKAQLTEELRKAISALLSSNGLSEGDIIRIIASGMITSEFGIYKLDHTLAPAGIEDLKRGAHEVTLEEISAIPFFFICGVKALGESAFDCNMMRGEETELMGIMKVGDGDSIYLLPGSHSKIIRVNGDGRIFDFRTTLTGEMIAALTKNTILSTCIDLSASLYTPALLEGYKFTDENGISESLIKTRALQTLMKKDADYLYSFFLGSILHSEIKSIIRMPENNVVIGGRREIRHALGELLRNLSTKCVRELSDAEVNSSVTSGAVRIFEL